MVIYFFIVYRLYFNVLILKIIFNYNYFKKFFKLKLQNYIKIFVKIILWIKIFNTELYYYEKFFI